MTGRQPCPPAPGPLEAYARQFDGAFASLAQRRAFRAYLHGLLLPRERTKTLTALAGTEPVIGAQAPPAQRLQWFLSESRWEAEAIDTRRLMALLSDPATCPSDRGVLIIDETGDPKEGTKTAHVARQYLGSIGKIGNGIVAVTSLWADADLYYPLHVRPYTPAGRLARGKHDPAFRTKPQLAVELVDAALAAGITFRAVIADCFYGENPDFEGAWRQAQVPFVLGIKPSHGVWAPIEALHTPQEAALATPWDGPTRPGGWVPIVRRFRDGHRETWWAAELALGGYYGPDRPMRLVAATTDPATLPLNSSWYLITNLPRPGAPPADEGGVAPADLAEVVRLYGLRQWVEQSYRQVKGALGWADWQVRSDRAIRRHWALVCCAFSFCWWAWGRTQGQGPAAVPRPTAHPSAPAPVGRMPAGRGEKVARPRTQERPAERELAGGAAAGPGLAGAVDVPVALVARLVDRPAAPRPPGTPRLAR